MSNCKVLKLTNGETIIAFIEQEFPDIIEVSFPLKLGIAQQKEGISVALFKWDYFADMNHNITLNKTNIISASVPSEGVMQMYEDGINRMENIVVQEGDKEEFNESSDNKSDDLSHELDEILEMLENMTNKDKTVH